MRESLATPNRGNNISLLVACGALALVATVLFGEISYDQTPFQSWDLASYREMAHAAPAIARGVSRPFAYRVLGPWLAGVLPGPDPLAFRLLTTAALVATSVCFARFLLRRGLGPGAVLVAITAFAFNKHMFGYPAWNPFQIGDALAMLALVLLVDAMIERRWHLFAIVFLGGMLARESVLLMVPTALAFVIARRDEPPRRRLGRELGHVLVACAPGFVALAILRITIPVTGEMSMIDAFIRHVPKLARIETWLRLLVNVPAPLTFLPLVCAGVGARFFRTRPYAALYLVLVFLSTLFGSNNERLMGPAFVMFFWLVATIVDHALPTVRSRALLTGLVLVTSLDHLYALIALPSERYTTWITAGTLVAATLVAVRYRRVRTSYGETSGPTGSR